jgi:hypothetical protein
MPWGIKVKFKQKDEWSNAYTYKSDIYYPKGEAVIVPTGDWYSVGKVTAASEDPNFNLAVEYKWVIGSVTELSGAKE